MSLEVAKFRTPVDEDIVETLEQLLKRAKAGELVSMAFVGITHRHELCSSLH